MPILLVAAACLFHAVIYRHVLTRDAPEMNDHVLHFALAEGALRAWQRGDSPHDFWLSLWGQGFPVARYYQNLPHLAVAFVHLVTGGLVSMSAAYRGAVLAGLTALPLAFAAGARALGMSALAAALVGVCSTALSASRAEPYFLGMQPDKYLSMHGGMFPQLFGILAFAVAVGVTQRALLRGRRIGLAVVCLSMTWLCHLLFGYSASLLAGLALVRGEARGQRRRVALRLAGVYAATFVIIAHQLVPALRDSTLLSRSLWESATYWDGFGVEGLLLPLVRGGVFDGDRWPVLTVLVAGGLLWTLAHARNADAESGAARFAALSFVLALFLALGRPVWGGALNLLPFAQKLPLHRFFCVVQYAGLLLCGVSLAALSRALRWQESRRRALLASGLVLALLAPNLAVSVDLAQSNATWRASSAYWYARNREVLRSHFDVIRELSRERPGRGYAGASWDWGREFGVANLPFYAYWAREGLPAVSYFAHTMGLNSDLDPLFDPARRDHYDLYNVRYLVAPRRALLPSFAEPVHGGEGMLTATVDTRGYFDLVHVGHLLDVPESGTKVTQFGARYVRSTWHAQRNAVRIRWRQDDVVDPGLVPLAWDADPPANTEREPAGAIERVRERDGQFETDLFVREPTTLLFRMTYHPSWHAMVDGTPREVVMLAPSHMGIALPPGRHHVVFRYEADPVRRALLWPTFFMLGAALWFDFRRRTTRTREAYSPCGNTVEGVVIGPRGTNTVVGPRGGNTVEVEVDG